ncbi:MAG: SMC-Scp complex subunit ScpB [Planctomycetota bacterium]
MDDISREPLPGAPDPGRGRQPTVPACRKGPPELAVFEAGDIDRMSIPDRQHKDDKEPPDPDGLPPLETEQQLARALMGVLLSSREALSFLRLAEVCDRTPSEVSAAVARLAKILAEAGLPLELRVQGERVRLFTAPEVYPLLRRLNERSKKSERLSPAALETLAVVAYRQPVMRAEIEAIRGVQAGPMLRSLLEHRLLRVVGRADVPGRPLQYGTTQHFLDRFGLESLEDLPSVKEFRSLG